MNGSVVQAARYVIAVMFGPVIGQVGAVPFAVALDVLWGGDVTGGSWVFTIPNLLLTIIQSVFTGCAAGWIAGQHGKLTAAISNFTFLAIILTSSAVLNRDLMPRIHMATHPMIWEWIGLVPAILGGHYAVKMRSEGLSALFLTIGVSMSIIGQIGALAFHLYTVYVAFKINGIFSAILVFVFPVLSQLWWTWTLWNLTGQFWNAYSLRFALLIVWGAITLLLLMWAGRSHEKRQEKRGVELRSARELS